ISVSLGFHSTRTGPLSRLCAIISASSLTRFSSWYQSDNMRKLVMQPTAQIVPTAAAFCQGHDSRGAMRGLIAQKVAAAAITTNGTIIYRLRESSEYPPPRA